MTWSRYRALVALMGVLAWAPGCRDRKDEPASRVDTAAMTSSSLSSAPPALTRRADGLFTSWNGEDPAAIAAYFSDSAVVHASDSTYTGRGEIRDRWLANELPRMSRLSVADRQFSGTNAAMTESGKFHFTFTAPKTAPVARTGSYTTTWARQGSEWKVTFMTIIPDLAPPSTLGSGT